MIIKLASNKEQWNSWLIANSKYSRFLQSWEWGEVLRLEGKRVERLQAVDGEAVVAQAQVVYQRLPLKGPWHGFCPRGPVVNAKCQMPNAKSDPNDQIYKAFIEYWKRERCIFFRFEPQYLVPGTLSSTKKTIDINPRATTILDLNKSDEALLANMYPKTRYNIRVAEKKKLDVRSEKNLDVFWDLIKKTGQRDGFRLHNKKHYQFILQSPLSYQLTAYKDSKPLATAVFVGFGNTFTYLFGASDHSYRQLMAPHLVQWQGIQLGKKLGYHYYDFFGVAPNVNQYGTAYDYDAHHQYAGVTRFKLGFGGKVIEDPGTYDLIISPVKYRIYQFLRTVRRFI